MLLRVATLSPRALGSMAIPRARPFFIAFVHGDYAECVQRLRQVRRIAYRCGGSLVQCDVIHLTLTEAALRARRGRLARVLVAERLARNPASRLNRFLQQRLGTRPKSRERRASTAKALLA
jgi:hypothetical protein